MNIYRVPPQTAACTLFSGADGLYTEIDHILNIRKTGKSPNTWKPKNKLLCNHGSKKSKKKKVKNTFSWMKINIQLIKTCETPLKQWVMQIECIALNVFDKGVESLKLTIEKSHFKKIE